MRGRVLSLEGEIRTYKIELKLLGMLILIYIGSQYLLRAYMYLFIDYLAFRALFFARRTAEGLFSALRFSNIWLCSWVAL